MDAARHDSAAQGPWATSERLLVCVGPSPSSAKLIRTARRMAAAFDAEWIAVAVETRGENARSCPPENRRASPAGRTPRRRDSHPDRRPVAQTIVEYARSRNVTKIVVGKTDQPWWRRLLGTVVDQLLEQSGDIDVYVIRGEPEKTIAPPSSQATPEPIVWRHYVATAAIVALSTGLGALGYRIHGKPAETNVAMIFLLGVASVAVWFGRGPAVLASVASVMIFDFFFIPPFYSFSVDNAQYFLTFAVMLVIGLIISTLTARVREQLRLRKNKNGAPRHFTS